MRTGVVTAQRGFHRGILSADDEQALAEVGVRVLEVMAHVRKAFAGDVEAKGEVPVPPVTSTTRVARQTRPPFRVRRQLN
ncbi:MAG: hypothetical protein JWO87_4017 [Phycisphaerales bacterium]|nr:hypothetical protein [Phycisphaerales bacterium]